MHVSRPRGDGGSSCSGGVLEWGEQALRALPSATASRLRDIPGLGPALAALRVSGRAGSDRDFAAVRFVRGPALEGLRHDARVPAGVEALRQLVRTSDAPLRAQFEALCSASTGKVGRPSLDTIFRLGRVALREPYSRAALPGKYPLPSLPISKIFCRHGEEQHGIHLEFLDESVFAPCLSQRMI